MTIELGLARGIDAQSFGEPGQRTFRLRVLGAASESVWLWTEKEHLRALAMAIRQLLSQLNYRHEAGKADVAGFPEVAESEFRVGLMAVGFSQPSRTLVLQVNEIGVGEEDEPTLRVGLTLEHCASLAAQMEEIIAGGRPTCPLCGASLDASGHACIRSNGHSDQPIPEDSSDETS